MNAVRPSPLWSSNRLYYRMPVGYAGEGGGDKGHPGGEQELLEVAESRRRNSHLGWSKDQARAVLDNVRAHIGRRSDYSYEEEYDDDEYEYEEYDRKGHRRKEDRERHYYYGFTGNRVVPILPPAHSPIPQTRPQITKASSKEDSTEVVSDNKNDDNVEEYRYSKVVMV